MKNISDQNLGSHPLNVYGDEQRITTIFNWFIGVMSVSLLGGIFILLSNKNVWEAGVTGFCILPVLVAIYLVHRKKFEGAATLLAIVMITLMTLLATNGQGVHNISILGFPAILIVASLVTRKRIMVLLTLFCVICTAWLVFGELSGVYTPNPLIRSVPGDFFSVSLIVISTAFMVRLIAESLFRSNRQIQKELANRKQVEEALRENEIFLRAIINNIPLDLWVCDAEGRYILQNAISYNLAGDLSGKTVVDLNIPDDMLADYKRKHMRALHGEKVSEEVKVSVGGEERFVLSVQAPVQDNNEILGFVGMNIDMTDYKRVEEELRASQERFALAVEGSNDGIWDWDLRTNASYASSRWYDMLGYEPGELEHGEGEDLMLSLMHSDDREHYLQVNEAYFKRLIPAYQVEVRLRHKDGSYRWILSRGKALRDKQGQPYRMAGSHTDITERKLAEEEREKILAQLKNKNDELQTTNAELERFTYTVSHDLKSPLITISGFLGYLEKDTASGNMERVKRDSQRIQEAVSKMYSLLNELLELSRIGRLMNPPEEVAFDGLVREALDNVQGQLQQRSVTLTVQTKLPAVYGDRQRLVEVMQNLLDNAVKFMGDQSDPQIEIGQREEGDKPVFFVKDNGIGIAPEYQERIFGLFNKLDPKTEGTGVGLAIVKRIIEVHGGTIWVESGPGKGSTFFFTLQSVPKAKDNK